MSKTNKSQSQLCPAQQSALESILLVWGGVGRGKTTVLKEAHRHPRRARGQ